MLDLQDLVVAHGYEIAFVLGFAEFIGVPIASVPFMIAVGGLAAAGGDLWLVGMPLAVTAGALLADLVWYTLGHWNGRWMVDAACGLTSNPFACIIKVQRNLQRIGPRHIVVAKFTPGAANLIAPAAGLAELPARDYFPIAALALLLWSSLIMGAGWAFHAQVEWLIVLALRYVRVVFFTFVALIVAAGIWRLQKVRRHKGLHVRMGHSR